MAETTKIQWCDHTWNPWRGCEHATMQDGTAHPGCLNCYAEAQAKRNPAVLGEWGADGKRAVGVESYWQLPRKWACDAERRGVRESVFPSLMDPFEDRPELVPLRERMFRGIDVLPQLDFLLLTKRPQNIRRMWPTPAWSPCRDGEGWVSHDYIGDRCRRCDGGHRKNVHLIYSASDQSSLESGIGDLLECRDLAPVLGLSLEPLVGPISFRWAKWDPWYSQDPQRPFVGHLDGLKMLNWVIVGGESGPHARPCDVQWIRSIVQQCCEAGVPCFVKQLGAMPITPQDSVDQHRAGTAEIYLWPDGTRFGNPTGNESFNGRCILLRDKKGGDWNEWPADLRVRQFPEVTA